MKPIKEWFARIRGKVVMVAEGWEPKDPLHDGLLGYVLPAGEKSPLGHRYVWARYRPDGRSIGLVATDSPNTAALWDGIRLARVDEGGTFDQRAAIASLPNAPAEVYRAVDNALNKPSSEKPSRMDGDH